jgi:Zn-dependent protease with chaperone function
MTPLSTLDSFFGRFDHPWLAGLAAAGGVWLLLSVPLGYLGSAVHPAFDALGATLHLLGLAALLASGLLFAGLWWGSYLGDRLFAE